MKRLELIKKLEKISGELYEAKHAIRYEALYTANCANIIEEVGKLRHIGTLIDDIIQELDEGES